MKCRVCGREMLNRGVYFECSNILCDYEEDIGLSTKCNEELPGVPSYKSADDPYSSMMKWLTYEIYRS